MGLFAPKYPKDAKSPRKETRRERKDREFHERLDKRLASDFKRLERESKERSARFWEDYERRNGPGSVRWS